VSIPRRLGRLARGFVNNLQEDDRFRETLRVGRERGETLRETFGDAFTAAWRGASEEWNASEEERRASEERESGEEYAETGGSGTNSSRSSSYWQRASSSTFSPFKYPLPVLKAYDRLGLDTGTNLEEVGRKRRELIKRYHPDRFSDPEKRVRAERLTSEINAAHDTISRHLQSR
jgi:ATP-dependent DNA ligase